MRGISPIDKVIDYKYIQIPSLLRTGRGQWRRKFISDGPVTLSHYDIVDVNLILKSFPSTHIPIEDISFYTKLVKLMSDDGWKVACRYTCPKWNNTLNVSCDGKTKMGKICPYKIKTVYGFISNWRVNACIPNCIFRMNCTFRKCAGRWEWNKECRRNGKLAPIIKRYNSYKVEGIGDYYYKLDTAATLKQVGWKITHQCEYLVERIVMEIEKEIEEGNITMSLADQLGMLNGELTRFRDSMSEGDIIVTQQIGYMLMMVELGKLRLSKLKSLTVKTKIGEAFVPLVKDVQIIIKDAIALMDAHGWTTAGRLKMVERNQKSMRSKALDMLEGKDGSFELSEGEEVKALPEPTTLLRRRTDEENG